MKNKLRGLAWACVTTLGISMSALAAPKNCEQVVAALKQAVPYVVKNEEAQAQGPYVDLLQSWLTELGIELKWQWFKDDKEAEVEIAAGRADLLLAVPLSHARLGQYDYVHPALPEDLWLVWFSDEAFSYEGWNDLRGLKGWSAPLDDVQENFQRFAKSNLELAEKHTPASAFAALYEGRLDYVIYPKTFAAAFIDPEKRLQGYELKLKTEPLYLALGHQSACNDAWLRGQLAQKMLQQQPLHELLSDSVEP